ncbi:hypothetical protein [Sinorhizobium sp. GL28]|uniref:hypothetical protein n=1 Tax=Sinorhizobium sp. GL28 TaxID=1358418 RepID=UPI00071D0630|nr:hypothetical protein [Sinorhizobium sp. GL28]KSV87722.1 hypothetical protein N184_30790 [Sinorhizobium sp. GL28]
MNSKKAADEVLSNFEKRTGLVGLEYEDIEKGDRLVRVIYVSAVTDRFYSILNECIQQFGGGSDFHVTLKQRTRDFIISGPEARLLLKVLSESQNINQYSFSDDFFDRYTPSVTGAEAQIVSAANHVVTGRRGAGKSMLLLYCFRVRQRENLPNAWVDLQMFSGRNDEQAVSDVITEILYKIDFPPSVSEEVASLRHKLEATEHSVADLRKLTPRLRRLLESVSSSDNLFIYLDDLHVFPSEYQHILMDVLYSIARGNRVYLKISAIENLVKTYDNASKAGIEIPQDAQRLGLDYNLTTPDKATKHLEAILDSHAAYSGLPSIRRLCSSAEVLPRLTWVSAGVPRDGINLFSQSMLKAASENRKRVTVSNVNMAASDNLSIKIKDLQTDASASAARLNDLLEKIRNFCVIINKTNAFLVEIKSGEAHFKDIMSLVQLRLLHVISEGITPKEAGTKFMALILDYGLYTGVRAAASVELFNKQTTQVSAKDLRRLKILR